MTFSKKTIKHVTSALVIVSALYASSTSTYANEIIFDLNVHLAGQSGPISGDLEHPLQGAGPATFEITNEGFVIGGRSETWHALDLLRDFSGVPFTVGDIIAVSGFVVDAPAGTSALIGGADSPWSWATSQDVTGNQMFNLSLTLTEEHFDDNQFNRFRIQTNGLGENNDIVITSLTVARGGVNDPFGTAAVHDPDAGAQSPTAVDSVVPAGDQDFYVLHHVTFEDTSYLDGIQAGAQMSGEVATIGGRQAFRLTNITGEFTSGEGNYLNWTLPDSIPAGTEVRLSWDVFVPVAQNPNFQPGLMGPGININGQFGNPAAQPTNDIDTGRTIALDEWVTTTTQFIVSPSLDNPEIQNIIFRFRINSEEGQPSLYYISNIIIEIDGGSELQLPEWDLNLPSLAEIFEPFFIVGNIWSTPARMATPNTETVFLQRYNAITAENHHKVEFFAPEPGVWNFELQDAIVDWAEENNLFMIGHTLVWHSQSPPWLTTQPGGVQPLTRTEAIENMHNHIRTVASRYRGRIYSWDVVNEVIAGANEATWAANPDWRGFVRRDGYGLDATFQSNWYDAFANGATGNEQGSDYVFYAFRFARIYDPYAVLYYNDYNEHVPGKRDAIAQMITEINERWRNDPLYDGRLLIEGMGMQGHWGVFGWMHYPHLKREAIELYASTGVRISITELDLGLAHEPHTSENQQIQAERWAEYFNMFMDFSDVIHRVTIWGMNDGWSWRVGYATLFDDLNNAKPAFHAVVNAGITRRQEMGIPFVPGSPVARPNQQQVPVTEELIGSLDNVIVVINGTTLQAEVPAHIIDGRTVLPMRAIFEAIIPDIEIDWNADEAIITATWDDNQLMLQIGSYIVTLNGVDETIDLAPFTQAGRTLVPVRVVAESLGSDVAWNPNTFTVTITTN